MVFSDICFIGFDVDGTLVEHAEGHVIWQVLNRRFAGDVALNAKRYRAYLNGEMSYSQWVQLDVEGWMAAGATRASIETAIREELTLVPGARHVVHELAGRGYVIAVVSGTLDIVLEVLLPAHPFNHVFTNKIEFDDSGAIRGWSATPYDMAGKASALQMLSSKLALPTSRFAFVGDHLNDCDAMALVGCPVAYHPKHEDVRRLAKHVLPQGQLDRLLDLFPARV